MATFTPAQLQTKQQTINQIQQIVDQLQRWLQQYQLFQMNNYSVTIPESAGTSVTLDSVTQAKFLSLYDTLYTQLQTQITNF